VAPTLAGARPAELMLAATLAGSAGACVVTTYEGPGDPPVAGVRPATAASPEPTGSAGESEIEPADADDASPETISASHLLVMHAGSLQAPANITRSRDEARARAEEALSRARNGEDFAKLVAEYSDEPGAALRQGRLGRFTRNAMIKQFADAAFELEPGELSEVVETPFGFHVILRTE
jgi:hypothetical protein